MGWLGCYRMILSNTRTKNNRKEYSFTLVHDTISSHGEIERNANVSHNVPLVNPQRLPVQLSLKERLARNWFFQVGDDHDRVVQLLQRKESYEMMMSVTAILTRATRGLPSPPIYRVYTPGTSALPKKRTITKKQKEDNEKKIWSFERTYQALGLNPHIYDLSQPHGKQLSASTLHQSLQQEIFDKYHVWPSPFSTQPLKQSNALSKLQTPLSPKHTTTQRTTHSSSVTMISNASV